LDNNSPHKNQETKIMRKIHKSPSTPKTNERAPLSITLSFSKKDDEYVTQVRNEDTTEQGSTNWFGNYIEALEDFTNRTKYLLSGVIDNTRD
jgi:hypothetical protein